MFTDHDGDWSRDGLCVLVPSRGRPEAVAQLNEAFASTSLGTTRSALTFVVDRDDPTLDAYGEAVNGLTDGWLSLLEVEGGTMVKALNEAAAAVLAQPVPPFAVAFFGDDHRPRTMGWDRRYLDTLHQYADAPGAYRGVAMVYGDDTIQGPSIPTQIAMTSETVRRLGWMAPPGFRHLFIDNAWKTLGMSAGRISYLPGVTIEHLHPNKTGVWTEGHERVNSGEVWAHDSAEFERWRLSTGYDDFGGAMARLAREG